jgi:hypothetical protein
MLKYNIISGEENSQLKKLFQPNFYLKIIFSSLEKNLFWWKFFYVSSSILFIANLLVFHPEIYLGIKNYIFGEKIILPISKAS